MICSIPLPQVRITLDNLIYLIFSLKLQVTAFICKEDQRQYQTTFTYLYL